MISKRLLSLVLAVLVLASCSLSPVAQQSPTTAASIAPTVELPTAVASSQSPVPSVTRAPNTIPTGDIIDLRTAVPAEKTVSAETAPAQVTAVPTIEQSAASPTTEQATAAPQASGDLDDPARIEAAKPATRDQAQLAEAFGKAANVPAVARTTPLDVKVGDVETFWVGDVTNHTNYTVTAELRYAGSIVLMYVDTAVGADIDQSAIERSAQTFEQKIYPRDRALFGQELSPGIDGDPRLTILNTPLHGAGGYFSPTDTVVKAVNRFSNEREMFVIGINSYPIDSDQYGSTLAHEFQHMIEWNQQRRSATWFNEGMSMLAQDLNGYIEQRTTQRALINHDEQLTAWSTDASQTGRHYGTSQLFLRYFYEQYAGDSGLSELLKNDAGNNPEAFVPIAVRKRPEITSFADIYADWAVANLINDPSLDGGRYSYKLLPDTVPLDPIQSGQVITTVHQFGTDYLGVLNGPLTVTFKGDTTVSLTGAKPSDGRFMWWSNRGDDSVSTLTRAFDLSGVQAATLQFSTRYEIEKDFDYGFVGVSTDDGKTWTTLKGATTTDADPQGQNFGNGVTGVSGVPGAKTDTKQRGMWVDEHMDLTPFAGKHILLRFWLVEDTGYNATGMLIDNIRIPELNYHDDVEGGDGGWQAQGFVRTTGELPQHWALRLVQIANNKTTVAPVALDDQDRASVSIPNGARAALVVIGTTLVTTEPAGYSYEVGK